MFSRSEYEAILHPGDARHYWSEEFYEYYALKFELARGLAPKRIAEIGVRRGYSAWAFLKGSPGASYHGFDCWTYKWGGVGKEQVDFVLDLLPRPQATITTIDTQTVSDLESFSLEGPFNFVHVDGAHDKNGALHDIIVAWFSLERGGHIVVDGYDKPDPGVGEAVREFLELFKCCISKHWYVKTPFGDYVIQKGE